jgi:hypothetical protein
MQYLMSKTTSSHDKGLTPLAVSARRMLTTALLGAIPAGVSVIILQNINGGQFKTIADAILCLLLMHLFVVKILLPVYWSRASNVSRCANETGFFELCSFFKKI